MKKNLEKDFVTFEEMEVSIYLCMRILLITSKKKPKKYQFALDSKDQELAAKRQQLVAKDQQLAAKRQQLAAKDQELAAKDQQLAAIQAKIRSTEETMFNLVLAIERIQNISFQEALAFSGCSLEIQEKLLQMAQDKGLLVV